MKNKKNMIGDLFFGVSIFLALILVLYALASGFKLGNFILVGLLIGFMGTFLISMLTQRPGLILGFLGAIALIVIALVILLLSICGGMRH